MEVLPFGLLIFVAGTLLLANLWGVVDTKFAADAAAREATRWVVEGAHRGATATELRRGVETVARETMVDHGHRGPVRVRVDPADTAFSRCDRVEVTVAVEVPAIRVPFIGGFGDAFDVRATHGEIVDPLRSGVDGVAECLG